MFTCTCIHTCVSAYQEYEIMKKKMKKIFFLDFPIVKKHSKTGTHAVLYIIEMIFLHQLRFFKLFNTADCSQILSFVNSTEVFTSISKFKIKYAFCMNVSTN